MKTKTKSKKSSQVQSLVFDNKVFTARSARTWASKHDFKAPATDKTENTYRLRQTPPSKYKAFYTIKLRKGVNAVIGIPKKTK